MKAGIVGAGIMGRLLAFALLKAGHHVDLYDQNDRLQNLNCSQAAAGLLTPLAELEKSDILIYQLGRDALKEHWPAVLQQLNHPVYFQSKGSLILAHPRDRVDLVRFVDVIKTKLQDDKNEISHSCQKLNQDEIALFEPEIAKFDGAYYFPEEGHLDNQALLLSLGMHLNEKGVRWHDNINVTDVAPNRLIINGERMEYDMVFDCRGMGAKSVFTHLHGIRGELIWLHAPDVSIQRPIRFLHPRYAIYIVPRPENKYIIGASEIHSDDHSEISVKSILELLSAAYYLHPGFGEARILKTVTHCRPTLPHYLPAIRYIDGLIAINGLYRHGFLIAPALVADVMLFLEHGLSSLRYPVIWEKNCD